MLNKSNLHAYQIKAVDFIIRLKRCGLFLSMGMGKTSTTLTAVSDLLDSFAVRRVLIIAPLRVANSVWKQEAFKWSHLNHLRFSICTGNERQRRAELMRSADVFIINRENIPWLVELYGARWPFDCVIIDESSSFKNPSSQRFKRLKRVLPFISHIVLLTGTPSPNSLLDVWSQMYLIDNGNSLGKTLTGYRQRFFEADYMGYTHTIRPNAAKTIHALMAHNILSMSAEDYLEVPERIDIIETVNMPVKVAADYAEFERTLLIELESGDEIAASTAAVLANKLLQYANGALYTNKEGAWSELHTAKLDALAEIIEQNPNETILVAYNYKSDFARLMARFPQAQKLDKSPETVERWNKGEITLLLAHPASAGHGLNLQDGGAMAVWFGLNWSLELYQQFNARLHRQGQTRPTRIVHIVTEDSIDARVMGALASKDISQSALLAALKPQ